MKKPKPLWIVLLHYFNISNGLRKQQVKKSLAECNQPKNMSLCDCFGILQSLWDELSTYNPLPHCKRGKCNCVIGDQFQKCLDEERLQDFLFGVTIDIRGHMRSTILSQDPLPPFDRVYQMFLQEERLHFVAENHSEQAAIRPMAVKSNISRSHIPLICTHCHRKGHDEPNCWTKHGVPDRWELRNPRGGSRGGARGNRGGGRGAIQHHRNNNGRG